MEVDPCSENKCSGGSNGYFQTCDLFLKSDTKIKIIRIFACCLLARESRVWQEVILSVTFPWSLASNSGNSAGRHAGEDSKIIS